MPKQLAFTIVVLVLLAMALRASAEGMERVLTLAPSASNPRNSEGDFVQLKDGRVLFVYTHYTEGAADDAAAYLASRVSLDGGKSWSTEDVKVLDREGRRNVMSVSLVRMRDNTIAMLYLRKNGPDDCRPYIRFSKDECATWSDPILCIADTGYYVVNNDRLIQLSSGRLVIPAACHTLDTPTFTGRGAAMCYLSDDEGKTWRRSTSILEAPASSRSGYQEPGIVELKDGRMLMLARTDMGSQFRSVSADGGDTWTPAEPTELLSPVSPATIERIPSTGDLLLVWNDHRDIDASRQGKRTPLSASISRDDGATWGPPKTLEGSPDGWFCYTAMEPVENKILLGYCAGDRRENNGLALTQVTLVDLAWLYAPGP